MLAKGRLAIYSVQYWDEPFSFTVGVDFARFDLPPRLHCNALLNDERAVKYQSAVTDGVFEIFRKAIEAATVHDGAVEAGPYGAEHLLGLLLHSDAVDQLGGRDAVVANAPAVSVIELEDPNSGGSIVRFATTPRTATPDGQRQALDYIKPLTPVHWARGWPIWRCIGEPPARLQGTQPDAPPNS